MFSPIVRKQIAHTVENSIILVVITAVALGLTYAEDFCKSHGRHECLAQGVRVVSMYSFFVDAVVFCATITIVGYKMIRHTWKG